MLLQKNGRHPRLHRLQAVQRFCVWTREGKKKDHEETKGQETDWAASNRRSQENQARFVDSVSLQILQIQIRPTDSFGDDIKSVKKPFFLMVWLDYERLQTVNNLSCICLKFYNKTTTNICHLLKIRQKSTNSKMVCRLS